MTSTNSCHDWSGSGNRSISTAPAPSPISAGNSRPRRSDTRPTIGLTPVSSARGGEPRGADHRGAGAEVVEPQRREHADRAEQQAGDRDQPHPDARRARRAARRAARAASTCPPAGAGGVRSAHSGEQRADERDAAERRRDARRRRRARRRAGPTSAPATAAPIVVPIISPRRSRGAALATQRHRPGPRRGAADALDEARGVEHHDRVGEREHDARHDEQRQARAARSRGRPAWPRGSRRGSRRRTSPPGTRRRARPPRTSTGRTRPRSAAAAA